MARIIGPDVVIVYNLIRAMAKNGSTRCLFGQKRTYLKTIAASESVMAVSDCPTPTKSRFWPKATGYSR